MRIVTLVWSGWMLLHLVTLLPLGQGMLHRAALRSTALPALPAWQVSPRVLPLASHRRGHALLSGGRSSRRAERRAAREAAREAKVEPAGPHAGVAPPAAAAEALPTGWTAEVDAASGMIYYANSATGVSQWERPMVPSPVAQPTIPALEELPDAMDLDTAAVVRDAPGVALPTLDDFRAREREATEGSPAPETVAVKLEAVQERLLELLTFDTIDERPVNEEPYDWTARVIGRGLPNNAGAYLLPYLQSGHLLLALTLLLSTCVSYPGFPLTEVPAEYRELLFQGLTLTYLINALAAVYARGIAERKQEPVDFWTVKTILFGGLALNELARAVPDPLPEYKQRQQRRR